MCVCILAIGLCAFRASGQVNNGETDTMLMVNLPPVNITGDRHWENDTVRYRYNQTRYYIKTILPYLIAATKFFHELDAKVNDPNVSRKERRAFVSAKEDELHDHFEKDIKKLNVTQGALLIKLIGRQTGVNIYSMLQEFKNPLTAIRWQTWSRLNGFNLNKKYNPDDEPMLEHIMESLGYPLPAFYAQGDAARANGY